MNNTQKQLEQIIANRQRYIVKTNKQKRDINTTNITLEQLADTLATLVNDLKKQGILR